MLALSGILSRQTINVADSEETPDSGFADPKIFKGYQAISHLTIPLKNSQEHVIGVLQLVNAKEQESGQVIPFDQNLQRMMESFSSLAVAALEAYIREQRLKQEIQQLRIEIDEVKRQQQVAEITETDFFQDLKNKAEEIRRRGRRSGSDKTAEADDSEN